MYLTISLGELKTLAKADFFHLKFFQATVKLGEKHFFQIYFFQQIKNCFETT